MTLLATECCTSLQNLHHAALACDLRDHGSPGTICRRLAELANKSTISAYDVAERYVNMLNMNEKIRKTEQVRAPPRRPGLSWGHTSISPNKHLQPRPVSFTCFTPLTSYIDNVDDEGRHNIKSIMSPLLLPAFLFAAPFPFPSSAVHWTRRLRRSNRLAIRLADLYSHSHRR